MIWLLQNPQIRINPGFSLFAATTESPLEKLQPLKRSVPKPFAPTIVLEKNELINEKTLDIVGEIETDWNLILHDDDFHYFEEVTDLLVKCCPMLSGTMAHDITCQVHTNAVATVVTSNKKIVTEYMRSLQAAGLTVSMVPDKPFDGSSSSSTAN
jgi:ATP-dependent Clp protease adaptor protein ClpS